VGVSRGVRVDVGNKFFSREMLFCCDSWWGREERREGVFCLLSRVMICVGEVWDSRGSGRRLHARKTLAGSGWM
jgi:hypothetical protein